MATSVPCLPLEVLSIVVDELWDDYEWSRGTDGDVAALALTSRAFSKLCGERRYQSLCLGAPDACEFGRLLVGRRTIADQVRELVIYLHKERDPANEAWGNEAIDVVVALLSAASGVEALRLGFVANFVGVPQPAIDGPFHRIVGALARFARPTLKTLHLKGASTQVMSISASIVGSIISYAPGLADLSLEHIELLGPTLGGRSHGVLAELVARRLECEESVARELAELVGPRTVRFDLRETVWRIQRILLSGVEGIGDESIPARFLGSIDATSLPREPSGRLNSALADQMARMPRYEALWSNISQSVWLHPRDAVERDFDGVYESVWGTVAGRLTDATYGRRLKRIEVTASKRDSALEAVCASRGITIDYWLCVTHSRSAN